LDLGLRDIFKEKGACERKYWMLNITLEILIFFAART
jgi:hypothetical protein